MSDGRFCIVYFKGEVRPLMTPNGTVRVCNARELAGRMTRQ